MFCQSDLGSNCLHKGYQQITKVAASKERVLKFVRTYNSHPNTSLKLQDVPGGRVEALDMMKCLILIGRFLQNFTGVHDHTCSMSLPSTCAVISS